MLTDDGRTTDACIYYRLTDERRVPAYTVSSLIELRLCYMPQDIVGAEDGDSYGYNQGGKDCYMHRDSVGAEDSDSYGYNQGGKDCYMPRDSVCAEDSDSYGYNQGDKDRR